MVGRISEQEELKSLLDAPESVFAAVYGRRRVGKTYLVRKTFGNSFAFDHVGMSSGKMADQLESFRNSLIAHGHRKCPPLKSWIGAFEELKRLLERCKASKKVVFIDELPWMDTSKSRFIPAFEHFWNSWAAWRNDIVLIVCGSATSWLLNKVINSKGGLHNRVTKRIRLEPFTLEECERLAEERGLALDRHQIVECYMVFGGVAYYWSLLEKGLSVAQNIDRLFFSANGALRGEYQELYKSLFRIPEPYERIVSALGTRKVGLTRSEVATVAGLNDNGALTKYLEELEQCGFVRKYLSFGKVGKDALFQLVDNFTLFYFCFRTAIHRGAENYWLEKLDAQSHVVWTGFAFERVCLLHVRQIRVALGISGVATNVCAWSGSDENGRRAQIDLLLDRNDRVITLCEMKFADEHYALTKKDIESIKHKRAAFRFATGTRRAVHLTIVTTEGLVRNSHRNEIQSEITLNDLFAPVRP